MSLALPQFLDTFLNPCSSENLVLIKSKKPYPQIRNLCQTQGFLRSETALVFLLPHKLEQRTHDLTTVSEKVVELDGRNQ